MMPPDATFPAAGVADRVRLKLTIAYDGSGFHGWQSQPSGNTVQDILEAAFRRIVGKRVVVHGAGRTDSGVHALAQGAHADVPPLFEAAEWRRILNFNLPPEIRIMRCRTVGREFDARHSARGKIYRYFLRSGTVAPPHEAQRVWLIAGKLDGTLLRKTGALFVGRHDFGGFAVNKSAPGRTVRTIFRISVSTHGSLTAITFEGEGFLHRMVRMLTGSMVRVATGQEDLAAVQERLKNPSEPEWTLAAPAHGLHLVKVIYGRAPSERSSAMP